MIILKKPGKKVICIMVAVCVVVIGSIVALVLYMNREVAPWDTVSWSTTSADIRSRFGEPDYSARHEGGGSVLNYDKYKDYEFLGIPGEVVYSYVDSKDSSTIFDVKWGYSIPDNEELKQGQIEKLWGYLTREFGNPQKYTDDDAHHSDIWYNEEGKEITLTEWFYDMPVVITYNFYNND